MPIEFADFLAAKYALDERSLNREVRGAFRTALRGLTRVQCLDVGAGTGSTVRRMLDAGLAAPLTLTALDRDARLLERARAATERWLREAHAAGAAAAPAPASPPRPAIRFAAEDLADHRPDAPYNVITAHAFLDITPLAPALRRFAQWLAPGGYLYASINYDGETTFSEAYEDAAFERRLLAWYNETMEHRRVGGQKTGGAYSGRRLVELLPAHGFTLLAHGSSDWVIAPESGRYRDDDALCLTALLEMIHAEGVRAGSFELDALERWHEDRRRRVREGRLRARVSQTDVLARRDPLRPARPS